MYLTLPRTVSCSLGLDLYAFYFFFLEWRFWKLLLDVTFESRNGRDWWMKRSRKASCKGPDCPQNHWDSSDFNKTLPIPYLSKIQKRCQRNTSRQIFSFWAFREALRRIIERYLTYRFRGKIGIRKEHRPNSQNWPIILTINCPKFRIFFKVYVFTI